MQDRHSSRRSHDISNKVINGLRKPLQALWFVCLVLLGSEASAEGLSASVDREELAVGETLQLTISSKLDASLGISLFNLNTLDIDSPDVTALEKDFEILDRQQNYRVQFENNVNNSLVAWTYTLSPKRPGTLTIPSLSLEDESTDPIEVEVTDAPKNPADSDLMVEMTIDKQTAYVGEQMLLTVKLLYSNELVDGQLAHPDAKGALFRQLEKQKEYSQTRAGKRFEVVERQYAVFAEDNGQLEIPAVKFSGRFVNRRFGRGRYETVASQAISVEIKDPPAAFDGRTWLPAMGFSISEKYEPDLAKLKVGESVTRTITLQGLGLESATLPPVTIETPDGVRVYPGQSETSEEVHAAGITGVRSQEYALIATRPGRFVLPEIRIAWWDVMNNEQRVAILPERVMQVVGSAADNSSPTPRQAPGSEDLSIKAEPVTAPAENVTDQASVEADSGWFWPLLSLVLALLCLLLGWAAWHYRQLSVRSPGRIAPRRNLQQSPRQQWTRHDRAVFEAMTPSRFASAYSIWLQKQSSRPEAPLNASALDSIHSKLSSLQQSCFGNAAGAGGDSPDKLQAAIIGLTGEWLSQPSGPDSEQTVSATSLYPERAKSLKERH